MADKNQNSGSGKKILGFLGVMVLLAIVAVLVVISIPPKTTSALDLLNTASTKSFMMSSKEELGLEEFKTKIESNATINNYFKELPKEMEDVYTISISLADVLDFYGDYVVFMKKGNAFKDNYKEIKVSLTSAMMKQRKLNEILDKADALGQESYSYLQDAWVDFREVFADWLEEYSDAIDALRKSFKGSMGKASVNNLASIMILDTIADYTEVLSEDFESLVEEQRKNPNAVEYTYSLQGKVKGFKDFTAKYLSNNDIKNFKFDSTISAYYENLNRFYEIYDETDMINAISSIKYNSSKAVVTKTYEGVTDPEDVYMAVKTFLVGGV